MAKETFYFSHDYNAMSDEKIKNLICEHGLAGYGAYWAIVEMLYNNANALRTHYKSIAFDLHTDENFIKSIINDFDLFIINDGYFGSTSVERRLNERSEKSKMASESANRRWQKHRENANALRSECECNAIKESKVNKKENKESNANKLAERSKRFYESIQPFISTYKKEMLRAFFDYWSEPNKSNTKMKFELEKTWDVQRRLKTWADRETTFNKNKLQQNDTKHQPAAPYFKPIRFSEGE